MALPGVTNVGTMLATARQQADMVNSTFCTDAEVIGYLNASYFELFNILVQKYGDDYYIVNNYQFTTDGTNEFFSLPDGSTTYQLPSSGGPAPAFFKLLGVDLWISSTNTTPAQWFTLHRFNFGERNRWGLPNAIAPYGYIALRYRLAGNINTGAGQLWLKPLPQNGQLINVRYVPRLVPLSNLGTVTLSTVVAGNTLTINGTVFTGISGSTSGKSFHIGASDTLTAVEIAVVINATLTTMTASASTNIVTITPSSGSVTWSASSTMALSPTGPWAYTADLISGWEEYAIVDTTIKMLAKEESDIAVQMARKRDLLMQIESAATNRDAGEPQTVVDVQSPGFYGGFSSGQNDGGVF